MMQLYILNMQIKLSFLRQIIQEELHRLNEAKWNVYRTKKMQRFGDPIQVDASTTDEAGKLAARQFGAGVDPYTLDVEKAGNVPSSKGVMGLVGQMKPMAGAAAIDMLRALRIVYRTVGKLVNAPVAPPPISTADLDRMIDPLLDASYALGNVQAEFSPLDELYVKECLNHVPHVLRSLRAARSTAGFIHLDDAFAACVNAKDPMETLLIKNTIP